MTVEFSYLLGSGIVPQLDILPTDHEFVVDIIYAYGRQDDYWGQQHTLAGSAKINLLDGTVTDTSKAISGRALTTHAALMCIAFGLLFPGGTL